MISRRHFLKTSGAAVCALCSGGMIPLHAGPEGREARYYTRLKHHRIQCHLCPRNCEVGEGERGHCGVRENRDGRYYSLIYGNPSTIHVDPIEKKPLFHFYPDSNALSLASVGCNVHCKFCQNWELSQSGPGDLPVYPMSPAAVVQAAHEHRCRSIAFTYSEPVVNTEYILDTAWLSREQGIHTVMISNGYINAKPIKDLCKALSAVKIDLKAFNQRFYKAIVDGELRPVLDTLERLAEEGMWTEIVYLLVPGQNDDVVELKKMSYWIKKHLGTQVPLHYSRFHPQYRLTNLPSTPVRTLKRAREISLDAGLEFVYIGNVPGDDGENTYCPHCNELLIHRIGFAVVDNHLRANRCPACGSAIPGLWSEEAQ